MNDQFSKLQPALADGDEETFRAVVDEHAGIVYQAALRRLNGDHALAEDAAQLVFVELQRKAAELPADTILPAWLHRQTCFVTAKQVRGNERRRLREAESGTPEEIEEPKHLWNEIKFLVDSAVNSLGDQDRDLLVLRFWSGKSIREAGEFTGISENAAQKRITRSFEALRAYLLRYGITGSVAALTVAVSENAAAATSASVTGAIASHALTDKSPGLLEALNPMDWFLGLKTKPIVAMVVSLLALTLGTTGFMAGRKTAQAHHRAIRWQVAIDQAAIQTPVKAQETSIITQAATNTNVAGSAAARTPTIPEIIAEAAEHYRNKERSDPESWALAYLAAQKIPSGQIGEALAELEKYRGEKKVFDKLGPIFNGILARTDPDAALEFAAENFTGEPYQTAIGEVINEWAKQDPTTVWKWYRDITASGDLPISSMHWSAKADEIFAEWVALDPPAAMAELNQISTSVERGAFRGVTKAVLDSPRREEILTLLNQLPNERQKRRIAHDVAGDWARQNAAEAADWAASMSFESPAAHLDVLGEVAEEWFPNDPHAAGKWLIANAPAPLKQKVTELVAEAFTKL